MFNYFIVTRWATVKVIMDSEDLPANAVAAADFIYKINPDGTVHFIKCPKYHKCFNFYTLTDAVNYLSRFYDKKFEVFEEVSFVGLEGNYFLDADLKAAKNLRYE